MVTTSQKMAEIVRVGTESGRMPSTTLAAVIVSVKALIPEVEALEANAAPGFVSEARMRGEALKTQVESAVVEFRKSLADSLRAAAKNLDRGTDA